jgi:hypothetical protein
MKINKHYPALAVMAALAVALGMMTGFLASSASAVTASAPAQNAAVIRAVANTGPEPGVSIVTPAKGGPRGVSATGPLKMAAHQSWCITAPTGVEDRDRLFMAQCVPGDASQTFVCTMFRGYGECAVVAARNAGGLDIGQYGSRNGMVRAVDPNVPGNNWLLTYQHVKGNQYVLCNVGYGGYAVAMPVKPVKDHVFPLVWLRAGTRGYFYSILFPEFKEDPAVVKPAAATAVPAKGGPHKAVTTAAVIPGKGGPTGEYAQGELRGTTKYAKDWCVAGNKTTDDRDVLYFERCIPNDAFEQFYCTKFRGFGECALIGGGKGLDIGQYGKTDLVLAINPDTGGNNNYILMYLSAKTSNTYALANPGYYGYQLAYPVQPKMPRVYPLTWQSGGKRAYGYSLYFAGTFKPDKPSVTRVNRARAF